MIYDDDFMNFFNQSLQVNLRVYIDEIGQAWFVLSDVLDAKAETWSLQHANKWVESMLGGVHKTFFKVRLSDGTADTDFVTTAGAYYLYMVTETDRDKSMIAWLKDDVIPQIRSSANKRAFETITDMKKPCGNLAAA